MILDSEQRRQLREQMADAFTHDTLALFVEDHLNVVLYNVISPGNAFMMECQLVIKWAERDGRLMQFLDAIKAHHPNNNFKAFISTLTAKPANLPPGAGMTARPYLVNRRPVIDRSTFWQHLAKLANDQSDYRVLVVNGGVGKSYSRWPVSHICDPSRNGPLMVCVEVNSGNVLNVDSVRLANLIATRMWGNPSIGDADNLAQPSRMTKDLSSYIIQRLAALREPTWLIIDELNEVNLDESAFELLCKLCQAVDGGECRHVWLFLFGLDSTKLDPRVGRFLKSDLVHRPSRQDIEDYVVWFANTTGKTLTAPSLNAAINNLDSLLPRDPDHASWDKFHEVLNEKCNDITQGKLS